MWTLSTIKILEEGGPLGEHAPSVHAVVSVPPGYLLGAGVVQAGEAVSRHGVVDLVKLIGKVTVSLQPFRIHSFLLFETGHTFCS